MIEFKPWIICYSKLQILNASKGHPFIVIELTETRSFSRFLLSFETSCSPVFELPLLISRFLSPVNCIRFSAWSYLCFVDHFFFLCRTGSLFPSWSLSWQGRCWSIDDWSIADSIEFFTLCFSRLHYFLSHWSFNAGFIRLGRSPGNITVV